jgi:hypothetical protein
MTAAFWSALAPHSPATVLLVITQQMARAFYTDPLFFAVSFGGVGLLMVAWSLTDASRRLRAWSPRFYVLIFGNRLGGTKTGGLVRGVFFVLLGLFFLYRFLKA